MPANANRSRASVKCCFEILHALLSTTSALVRSTSALSKHIADCENHSVLNGCMTPTRQTSIANTNQTAKERCAPSMSRKMIVFSCVTVDRSSQPAERARARQKRNKKKTDNERMKDDKDNKNEKKMKKRQR